MGARLLASNIDDALFEKEGKLTSLAQNLQTTNEIYFFLNGKDGGDIGFCEQLGQTTKFSSL